MIGTFDGQQESFMPTKKLRKKPAAKPTTARRDPKRAKTPGQSGFTHGVASVLDSLRRLSDQRIRDEMGSRYGIYTTDALGVRMNKMQALAKSIGKDHALALKLWKTGNYEARIVASYIGEPERLTRMQMIDWVSDIDNWGTCDTVCFVLFDRSPLAWRLAPHWAKSKKEFIKRTGFVLMACLAAHDKAATDAQFLNLLPLIEEGAGDDRNFVKKGVSWALRMIGRRNPALNAAALRAAKRLAHAQDSSCRWVGKTALRELTSPHVKSRLARRVK